MSSSGIDLVPTDPPMTKAMTTNASHPKMAVLRCRALQWAARAARPWGCMGRILRGERGMILRPGSQPEGLRIRRGAGVPRGGELADGRYGCPYRPWPSRSVQAPLEDDDQDDDDQQQRAETDVHESLVPRSDALPCIGRLVRSRRRVLGRRPGARRRAAHDLAARVDEVLVVRADAVEAR